jgi:blue copper oxidase
MSNLFKSFSRIHVASFVLLLTGLFLPFCAKSQFVSKLFIPDTISTADNDVIHLNMIASQRVFFPGATKPVRPGDANLFKGDTMSVATLCYSSMPSSKTGYLGPTLIWWKGDSVTMEVENRMNEHSTTHWHGAHVAPQNDGGPHQIIEKNTTWQPSFQIRDNAATMWYHPHLHGHTMNHVAKGLAGMIIVKDAADPFRKVLPNRYGIDDLPIVIQDKYFRHDTLTQTNEINTTCEMGTNFFVNGVWQPYVDVPAQPVRLRMLNGSAERTYCIFLRDSTAKEWVPFKVIASDAGYLEKPHTMGTAPTKMGDLGQLLIMMSGERYEIVFDGAGRENHQLYLMNMRNFMKGSRQLESFAGGPGPDGGKPDGPPCYTDSLKAGGLYPYPGFDATPLALMQINIKAADGKAGIVPSSFAPYAYKPFTAPVNKERKKLLCLDFKFQPPFSIDSIGFEDEVINDTIILGDIERWKITNVSETSHPLHIHDVHFFVESMTDLTTGNPIPVPMYMRGAKDVVAIPDKTEISFIAQFEDFATPIKPENCYMYHCHILGHEDGGMMHQFVVTTPKFGGVGVKEEQQLAKWSVYPNPTSNLLFVEIPENTNGTLRLFDLMGRKIQEWQTNETAINLDVSKVMNGMYLLQWENAGVTSSRRISILK